MTMRLMRRFPRICDALGNSRVGTLVRLGTQDALTGGLTSSNQLQMHCESILRTASSLRHLSYASWAGATLFANPGDRDVRLLCDAIWTAVNVLSASELQDELGGCEEGPELREPGETLSPVQKCLEPATTTFEGVKIYIIAWGSHEPIQWRAAPDVMAESAIRSIWKYFRGVEEQCRKNVLIPLFPHFKAILDVAGLPFPTRLLRFDESLHQMIGHAALIGEYHHEGIIGDYACLSHTGGDPGIRKQPLGSLFDNFIIARMNPVDVTTTHACDGEWDTPGKLAWRLLNQAAPRIKKLEIQGEAGHQAFKNLRKIKERVDFHYYGLNMKEIIVDCTDEDCARNAAECRADGGEGAVRQGRSALRKNELNISGVVSGRDLNVNLSGGCANMVASVLQAVLTSVGQEALISEAIPEAAHFEIDIPESLREISIPIVTGEDAFVGDTLLDEDVKGALEQIRKVIGAAPDASTNGIPVEFYDPTMWYDAMGDDPASLAHLRGVVRKWDPSRSGAH
ncbi:hypothetical protein JQX13_26320 [Archangium violaceum]|uniref:hypothetical protein n=1 Tax=Archangium violaceum TaxID=83451 RepID=UPI00193B2609|nr:hypothetical protein [Archangium violaceum]QRK13235.1 hypothetical protein JQX13_26320 [Archangium violaceum]